jgi:hypothetical protein
MRAVLTCKSNTAVFLYLLQVHIVNEAIGREAQMMTSNTCFMKLNQYNLLSTHQVLAELF